MRALLDTNVLSEIRLETCDESVKRFMRTLIPAETYISVITIGEISKGAGRLSDGRKRNNLFSWRDLLIVQFKENILSIDTETAKIWGELTASLRKLNVDLPIADGLIAATAIRHGLNLVTRNTRDFEKTGIHLINPWVHGIS